jgi:hypothetical protein
VGGLVLNFYFFFKHNDERHSLALKYDAYNRGLADIYRGYIRFFTSRSDFPDDLRQEFEKIRSRTFWYFAAPPLLYVVFVPALAVVVRLLVG